MGALCVLNRVCNLNKYKRTKGKSETRIPVDKNKWGANDNSYSLAPEFYYDAEFECVDCAKKEIWTAENQKYWFEELGKTINSRAIRCQICRAHIVASKEEQQRHMAEMAKIEPHPNEKFFKDT